jgi:hypothetical protein
MPTILPYFTPETFPRFNAEQCKAMNLRYYALIMEYGGVDQSGRAKEPLATNAARRVLWEFGHGPD